MWQIRSVSARPSDNARYGIDAKLFEWSNEITADCPRKQVRNLNGKAVRRGLNKRARSICRDLVSKLGVLRIKSDKCAPSLCPPAQLVASQRPRGRVTARARASFEAVGHLRPTQRSLRGDDRPATRDLFGDH
jgi:hypothetical protein